jgi:flagellar biogenesis protein FliO
MIRLYIVIAILLVAAVYARRVARRGVGVASLKVSGRASLSRTSGVAVVEADGRRFLVAVGANSAQLLAELDPAPPAEGCADPTPREPGDGRLPTPTEAVHRALPGTPASGLLDAVRRATTRSPDPDRRPAPRRVEN